MREYFKSKVKMYFMLLSCGQLKIIERLMLRYNFHNRYLNFISEMSPEQQKKLIEIRKKKQELLLEIQVSKNCHIAHNQHRTTSYDNFSGSDLMMSN